MSKIFENVRHAVGFGLSEDEMYNRAFEKGVLMKEITQSWRARRLPMLSCIAILLHPVPIC